MSLVKTCARLVFSAVVFQSLFQIGCGVALPANPNVAGFEEAPEKLPFLLPVSCEDEAEDESLSKNCTQKYSSQSRLPSLEEAFKEPTYNTDIPLDVVSYRLLVIPTFSKPVMVRVEKRGDSALLVTKRLSGRGGYDLGHIDYVRARRLTMEEWRQLEDLIAQASFWTLPRALPVLGNDGTTWELEAVDNKRHHFVSRWSPDGGSFMDLCFYLLELAGGGRQSG